jgi:DNA adenine methylase
MNSDKREQPLHLDMGFEEALERLAGVNIREMEEPEIQGKASPFVKWVGGKRNLINDLMANLPKDFNDYWEPFVGGGALFFGINEKIINAHLSDKNLELMIVYQVIKEDVESLIKELRVHARKHDVDYYYKVRARHNLQDPIKIAARFLYLNKTCYNGLYRVNKKGEFNVPVGRYKNPNIIQEENLLLCNRALQKTTIEYKEFNSINPKLNDFVYCDPPYHPVNGNSFTTYTKYDFIDDDQIKLRDFALSLHEKGVKVMLSNSNTKFIRNLYKNEVFTVKIVNAPRFINCKPGGRDNVEEVLITTYG